MHTLKKIFKGLVIALLCLISTGPAFAQSQQQQTPHITIPQVYVKNIVLNKVAYAAGDTIEGSFTIWKNDSVSVADLNYEVSLVGDFGPDGLPARLYDMKTFGPLYLDASQNSLPVNFSYTLPAAFSGKNLGIKVQLMLKSGIPLGWSTTYVDVSGGLSTATAIKSFITIDKQQFDLSSGPTIGQGQSAKLTVTLSNSSTDNLVLTPDFKVYNRSISGDMFPENKLSPITLKAKSTQIFTFDLPTYNNTPHVYLALLNFVDSQGRNRVTPPLLIRYIVGGQIVTINSITTSNTSVKHGETLPLILSYSGTPFDITNPELHSNDKPQNAQLDVKVFNEKDQLVGEINQPFDFNTGNTATLNLTAQTVAKAMRAEVTASNNGKVLATYTANLSSNYDQVKKNAAANPELTINIWYVVLLLVVGISGVMLLILNRNSRKIVTYSLAIGFALSIIVVSHSVHAYVVTDTQSINIVWDFATQYAPLQPVPIGQGGYISTYHGSTGNTAPVWYHAVHYGTSLAPQVFVNPFNTQTGTFNLLPNQQFYLTGQTFAYACTNNTQSEKFTITYQNNIPPAIASSSVYVINNVNSQNDRNIHTLTNTGFTYSFGPFTAPTTTGTYQIQFRVDNYTNVPGAIANYNASPSSVWNPGEANTFLNNDYQTPVYSNPTISNIGAASTQGDTVGYQTFTVVNPIAAQTITATNVCSQKVGLTWSTVVGAKQNTIYRYDQSKQSNNQTIVGVFAGTATSTTDTGINGGSWTYKVQATDANNNLSSLSPASAVISPSGACNPPAISLTASAPGISPATSITIPYGTQATINWNVANGPTSCTAGGNWATANVIPLGAGSWSTANLTTNQTYTLFCTNSAGGSNTATATIQVDKTASAKANLYVNGQTGAISVLNGSTAYLTWVSQNTTSCTGSGNGFSTAGVGNPPSYTTQPGVSNGPLTTAGMYTYTISCPAVNGGGMATSSVVVTVPDATKMTLSCSPQDASNTPLTPQSKVYIGDEINWVTQTTNATGHTIYWSGTNISTTTVPTGSSLSITYNTIGQKHICAQFDSPVANCDSSTSQCVLSPLQVKINPIFQEK